MAGCGKRAARRSPVRAHNRALFFNTYSEEGYMKRSIYRLPYGSLALAVMLTLTSPLRAQDDAAALYKSKCVSCHAADGSGNTPVGTKLGVKSVSDPEMAKQSDA